MPFVLCLVLFIPPAFAVADAVQRKFCEALPAVFLGLSLGLYVLSIFSLLHCAMWLVVFLWVGCFLYLVFSALRLMRKKQRLLPVLGLVAFVVAAALLWWMCRGMRYTVWDEFSHWGRALKAVSGQRLLPALAEGQDQFRDYPPGVSLIQALVMWLGRMGFREDVAVFVQGLFSVSLLLYPLRSFSGKGGTLRKPGAALLLVLAPACVFWNYYLSTMVDGLLGVLFGFVLVVHFLGGDGTYEKVLQCMALAMLPLVKSSGLFFALMAVFIIAVDQLKPAKRKKKTVFPLPGFLVLLVSTLVSAGSWKLFLWVKHVERRWQPSSFSTGNFIGLFTGSAPEWQQQTAKSYFASIFTETNYGWPVSFLPYMGFFLLFIGAFYLLRLYLPANEKPRWGIGFWGLWGAGLLYVASLLITYLYFFSEYEAVRLASLSRYLNTYVVAMLVFLTALLVHVVAEARRFYQWLVPLVAGGALWTVLTNPITVITPLLTAPSFAVSSVANLEVYSEAAKAIAHYAKADEARVYVVAQDDLGVTTLRLGYELFPQTLPDHVSSIGPHYADDDLLSLRITKDEWSQMLLEGYDFVYLFHVDDAFIQEFAPLFRDAEQIANGGMYRVNRGGEGPLLDFIGDSK